MNHPVQLIGTAVLAAVLLAPSVLGQGAGQEERSERGAAWTELLSRYDTSGNGVISRQEYVHSDEAFWRLDTDRNNSITADDFRPPQRGRDEAPRPGEVAPGFLLRRADGPGILSLEELHRTKPVALIFASYTMALFRVAAPKLAELEATYGDEVQFAFVYVREVHALDSGEPGLFPAPGIEDPLTLDGRRALCVQALSELRLNLIAAADDLNDQVAKDYDAWPGRAFLIDRYGVVRFTGEPGPRGFSVDDLELAILAHLSGEELEPSATVPNAPPAVDGEPKRTGDRGAGQGASARSPGILRALDRDGNGVLSPAEIDGAPAVLRSFDRDGDGSLRPQEVLEGVASGAGRTDATQPSSGPAAGRGANEGTGAIGGRRVPGAPSQGSQRGASQAGDRPTGGLAGSERSASERAAGPGAGTPRRAGATNPLGERSIESFDYDGDGRISRIEVPLGMLDRWELFDRNGDGYLSSSEQVPLKQRK